MKKNLVLEHVDFDLWAVRVLVDGTPKTLQVYISKSSARDSVRLLPLEIRHLGLIVLQQCVQTDDGLYFQSKYEFL